MAAPKTKYGPNAGRKRSSALGPGFPKGALHPVLLDHWMTLPAAYRASNNPVDGAKSGSGFHVMKGGGCDATIGRSSADRCGEKACAHFSYTHELGGVTLGVRVCAEHVAIAGEEKFWRREVASADSFAVWEVMTA